MVDEAEHEGHDPHPSGQHGESQDELSPGIPFQCDADAHAHGCKSRHCFKDDFQQLMLLPIEDGKEDARRHDPNGSHSEDGKCMVAQPLRDAPPEYDDFALPAKHGPHGQHDDRKGGAFDAASCGERRGTDEHDDDHGKLGNLFRFRQIEAVEARSPAGNGSEAGICKLLCQAEAANRVGIAAFHAKNQQGSGKNQDDVGNNDQLRVERKSGPPSPMNEFRHNSKADAAQDNQKGQTCHQENIVIALAEAVIVAKEIKSSVAEGGYRVENPIADRADAKFRIEVNGKQDSKESFNEKGIFDDAANQAHESILPSLVQGFLDGNAFLQLKAVPDGMGSQCGQCHDAQSADLQQEQHDDCAEHGQIVVDIHYGQSCDAGSRSRNKKGIYGMKTLSIRGADRQHQQQGADGNHGDKAQQDDSCGLEAHHMLDAHIGMTEPRCSS